MQEKRNRPVHGDIWKHFKGNLYEILECPVIHTETREEYVVYRALYGDYGVFLPAARYVHVRSGS